MSNKANWALTGGLGCVVVLLVLAVIAIPLFIVPMEVRSIVAQAASTPQAITPAPAQLPKPLASADGEASLAGLYDELNPGVVNIKVFLQQGLSTGQGAGSGFVFDEAGHIVTNNHVVADAVQVTAVFYNGVEARATVVGTDPDSDLAVVKVDALPSGVHPLPLGDSDRVAVGEHVIAIGNPFGLGSSMTAGIVSAVGRTIESGATSFSIPHAIQTDAAINPGNSGGPLIDLQGKVIGVNAQIATGGANANAGVGFSIPSNVVQRVAPALIERGSYEWPWLGVSGGSLGLTLAEANGLDTQAGAYIDEVVADSPADQAGLQGSSGEEQVNGLAVPVGGDVVVEVDGTPVASFDDLMAYVADRRPGDSIELTILRDGERQQVTVELAARPSE